MLIINSKGEEVTRIVYTPFGEVYEDDDNDNKDSYGLDSTTFKYTGQELDEETGLAYYQERYYDPQLGRFLTPDPFVPDWTNSQNLNRYVYVRNNPIIYEDPTGNFEILGRALVGAGIGIAIEVGLEYAYGNGNYGQAIAKGAIAGSVAAMTGAGVVAFAEKVSKIGKAITMSEKILKGTTVTTGDVLGGGVGAVTSGVVDVVQDKSPPNLHDTVPSGAFRGLVNNAATRALVGPRKSFLLNAGIALNTAIVSQTVFPSSASAQTSDLSSANNNEGLTWEEHWNDEASGL